mgnify:CR=1 FL=1
MTVNLLSQRLKAAKRELTALKTAHMRGLGNMKVYQQKVVVPPEGHTGIQDILVSVTTDSSYPPYPFVAIYPLGDRNNNWSMELTDIIYKNGNNIKFGLLWLYDEGTNAFYVVSSSPITNVSYTWM